jgi:hypothetical protein
MTTNTVWGVIVVHFRTRIGTAQETVIETNERVQASPYVTTARGKKPQHKSSCLPPPLRGGMASMAAGNSRPEFAVNVPPASAYYIK